MIDQLNRYRDKNGYICIKDAEILNKKTYGSREKYWLRKDGLTFLFKANQKAGEDIKEIINEKISNYLGIETAKYDIASYQGKKGVISLPFMNEKDIFLPVLVLNFQSKTVGNSNDILTIYKALLENEATEQELKQIMNEYFASQIQDIFTFQFDRNITNSGIIVGDKTFKKVPRFDSSGSFLKIYDEKKISSFFNRIDKETYIYNRGWNRTKLKITSELFLGNSMQEFINYRYNEDKKNSLPIIMREAIENADKTIEKLILYDLKETIKELNDYHIKISTMYKKLISYTLNISMEIYEQEKEKILLGHQKVKRV